MSDLDLDWAADILADIEALPEHTKKIRKVWVSYTLRKIIFETQIDTFPCPICGIDIDLLAMMEDDRAAGYFHSQPVAGSRLHVEAFW